MAPRPRVRRALCIGCGKCAGICPGHTIWVRGGKAHISRAGCIRCFCCHEMCPVKAIEVRRFALFLSLIHIYPPERAVTTHPAVVAACIRACVPVSYTHLVAPARKRL